MIEVNSFFYDLAETDFCGVSADTFSPVLVFSWLFRQIPLWQHPIILHAVPKASFAVIS